jgi:hypothetical protein
VHADPVRYHRIGTPFVGKQRRLCPLAFLGAVFSPVDDVLEKFFLVVCQRYQIYFSWHRFPPVGFYAVQ